MRNATFVTMFGVMLLQVEAGQKLHDSSYKATTPPPLHYCQELSKYPLDLTNSVNFSSVFSTAVAAGLKIAVLEKY